MVSAFVESPHAHGDFKGFATRHPCVLQIMLFLSPETRAALKQPAFIIGNPGGSLYGGVTGAFLADLERLEKQWRL